MKIKAKAIAQRLVDLNDLLEIAKEKAADSAPDMIDDLMNVSISLREIARKTHLSPTYLSRVRNLDVQISVGAFHKLTVFYELTKAEK